MFSRTVPRISFWIQGVVYYIFLLYCLVGYKNTLELCFYCKYGLYAGGFQTILGIFWVEGGIPTGYIAFVFILMTLVIVQRQAKREILNDEAEARDKRYFKNRKAADIAKDEKRKETEQS